MTPYCQRDYPQQLGTCNTTIAREGCAITCCGILADKSPDYVNNLGAYINGCLADWSRLALSLNLDYDSRRDIPVKYPCIAEVVLSGFQHFIVLKNENTQIDPWTGQEGQLKYQILSYRNLTPKGVSMTPRERFINFVASMYEYMRGKDPSTAELNSWVDKITADFNGSNPNNALSDAVWGFFNSPEWKGSVESRDCLACPEDLSQELKESQRKERDNWDAFIKVQKERDDLEQKLEVCQNKECICPPCPDLDILTPWELIKLAINKFLKV